MRVSVDGARCSGHARCHAVAPEFFTIDEAGYSDIGVSKAVPADLEEQARRGVLSCPERAMNLEE
jgi:ferredoxin